MEGMADKLSHVLQACYPLRGDAEGPEGPVPAGKQVRNNGSVFWCIRHGFCLVEEAEQEREDVRCRLEGALRLDFRGVLDRGRCEVAICIWFDVSATGWGQGDW